MTGDRRYLKPIPPALGWIEKCALETLPDGRLKLARRYEVDSNLPLYNLRTDQVNDLGYGLWRQSNEPDSHVAYQRINLASMRRDYERIAALSPEEARAEYARNRDRFSTPDKISSSDVDELIAALDSRGAWVEMVKVFDMDVTTPPPPGVKFDNYNPSVDDDHASIEIPAISTSSYIDNMHMFIDYLSGLGAQR
jgi:hypothetical protein